MRTWRPPKYSSVEELSKLIDLYFEETNPDEYTISGLALFLWTTRELLMDYQAKDEFSDTIKAAKLRIQAEYEKDLRKKGNAWSIFALKNFWWKDKTEVENTHKVEGISKITLE